MFDYRGKTALITGASTGIGAVFAKELAQRGMNLILVARSEDKLQALVTELSKQYGQNNQFIALDLTQSAAANTLKQEIDRRQLSIDLLINNAGFATYGNFETIDTQRELNEIQLNVSVLVELTHLFIPAMVQKEAGAILNVASIAGFQPMPYMAVYGATKAFVLSFSEALWAEYQSRGVRVLALCPGMTETPFHEIAGQPSVGMMDTPEHVVQVGLRGLERGHSSVISGATNTFLSGLLPRILPRRRIALIVKGLMQPHHS
jgi:uncharacterized protein